MSSRKPCGRVLGHGESCSPGYLCGGCEELNALDMKIALLQQALRNMHSTVHGYHFRIRLPDTLPEGSQLFGEGMLGDINNILRNALGRDDVSLKYFKFADDKDV